MTLKFQNHFPSDWDDTKILDCVSQIVSDPKVKRIPITGKDDWIYGLRRKYILDSSCCGLNIRIVLEPEDRGVLAAYPYTPGEESDT